MSMAEILEMLNEKVKEDDNRHSPWTRMVLEKDSLKKLRTVLVIEYAKHKRSGGSNEQ
ncbi:hypothetical protein LSA36186_19170 [Lachnoanaerobaculum sp. JCM 36186]|uniref:hypothetical protein n=1 Tax=Lachnoanaerobaculum sanguinis TaxID=3065809 RepID=UPI00275CC6D2|nr:hypothetical protein [Lachnoanaerobaculum sp. JCM 36186]GMO03668.1 hypothetical protein LSA36186_19170 [Lachnoanaerobaculum sp. JCM 36186]